MHITHVPTLQYTTGYRFRVDQVYTIDTGITVGYQLSIDNATLDETGLLTIAAGYAWDGASGALIQTANGLPASLVHDVLYDFMRRKLLPFEMKAQVDLLFYAMLKASGMWQLRADAWYVAVKEFGCDALNPRKIRSAP